ncbi:MAG: efflux transporter outer membrane subunit [Acidobacteriia bacterium]|nr:efflux transporter outer membrane subunit [Terriglobia bacterium]
MKNSLPIRRGANSPVRGPLSTLTLTFLIPAMLLSTACMVGPRYQRPAAPASPAFKEPLPQGWKEAQPNDGAIRGKWWEIYNDPALNALEEQVNLSNQNVLAAEAQFREARDAVRIARSGLFPTVSGNAGIVNSKTSGTLVNNRVAAFVPGVRTDYNLPLSLSYQADIWGSIRRTVRQSAENAQVSAAQLENARLTFQAELALDYFQLHGADSAQDLLERTVKSYQEYLDLTQNRVKSGVASGSDVAQAQAQLETARAQLIDLGVARAQFEHAIAILMGKPPSELTIPRASLKSEPPLTPPGVPSALLERRPDIATAERQMAAVNEQIGLARAAYFPTLVLNASAGLESSSFVNWFTWPSRFWSVGPQMAETLFDAGKRRAQSAEAQAAFDVTVANYRQTVLTGFQQVEDSLSALRVLAEEAHAEDAAVQAAEEALKISTYQYKAGTVSYLQVITSQAIALQDERTAVDLLTRRMVASVALIQALGGGWDASKLPSVDDIIHGK